MAMKELLYRLQPMQIYIVLALSIIYFLMQLFLSHITHALTLLVSVYHMLCNIVALSGCIMTIKHCKNYGSHDGRTSSSISNSNSNSNGSLSDSASSKVNVQSSVHSPAAASTAAAAAAAAIVTAASDKTASFEAKATGRHRRRARSLRNTFGWMRIEILTMLIGGIFLGAFCFSLIIEALQTLVHISHKDTMHHPMAIFTLALGGLILNAFCYLLIGGYTHHLANFRRITPAGDVVLDQMANRNGLVRGSRRLSVTTKVSDCNQINVLTQSNGSSIQIDTQLPRAAATMTAAAAVTPAVATASASTTQHIQTPCMTLRNKQTLIELMRDISSTIFVMICSGIIYFANNEQVTKFVDPIISIVSGITLLVLSYPYMKESCLILLQTIPASIDIEIFKSDLLSQFDDIVSVHDLHIWQMTSSKYVSTAHIVFHNPLVYAAIKDAVVHFFYNQGITIVTIQPEFKVKSTDDKQINGTSIVQCLMGCQSVECAPKTCCSTHDLQLILSHNGENGGDSEAKLKKSSKKRRSAKADAKSSSMLSLNVASLMKLRRFTGSTQNVLKKSASESHVKPIDDDSGDGESSNPSSTASTTPSIANHLNNSNVANNSIDELKESEFHEQCGERSEQRMPPNENLSRSHHIETTKHCEDSSLLKKSTDCNGSQEIIDQKSHTHSTDTSNSNDGN